MMVTNLPLLAAGPLTKETSHMLGILGHLFGIVEAAVIS